MSFDYEILSQNDLLELFPFGRSKLNALLRAGVLPSPKLDVITSPLEQNLLLVRGQSRT